MHGLVYVYGERQGITQLSTAVKERRRSSLRYKGFSVQKRSILRKLLVGFFFPSLYAKKNKSRNLMKVIKYVSFDLHDNHESNTASFNGKQNKHGFLKRKRIGHYL